jgi:hypothetical protein
LRRELDLAEAGAHLQITTKNPLPQRVIGTLTRCRHAHDRTARPANRDRTTLRIDQYRRRR